MNLCIRHPHQRAMITLAGFVGLALLVTLATWGLSAAGTIDSAIVWIGMIFFAFFGLLLVIIWILGIRQMRRAKAFLESERVLVSWTYSTAEWQQLKETLWQEEKGDWKVQFGCLAFLLGLAGLLTGIMLGWQDGLLAVLTQGLVGLMVGGLAGSTLGVLVAGSNYWSARRAHGNPEPGLVALGVNEIYASDDYFKGDGMNSYIREAKLVRDKTVTLVLELVFPPRPRMPSEEQWSILVPSQWVERVEEVLPVLVTFQESQTVEPD